MAEEFASRSVVIETKQNVNLNNSVSISRLNSIDRSKRQNLQQFVELVAFSYEVKESLTSQFILNLSYRSLSDFFNLIL